MSADRAASVLDRLLNRSRSTGENYNLLLSRVVIDRLMFRLARYGLTGLKHAACPFMSSD